MKKLSVLKFDSMTDEWLDFIAWCRSGKTHQYDIVEGPMANDTALTCLTFNRSEIIYDGKRKE